MMNFVAYFLSHWDKKKSENSFLIELVKEIQ